MPTHQTEIAVDPVKLGVSFVGEALVPGGSNLLKGNWKEGAIHLAAGIAARAALGLPGVLLVSANSLSKALTGRYLLDQVGVWTPGSSETSDEKPKTPAASRHT